MLHLDEKLIIKQRVVSYAIFVATLMLVFISLISVVFPALIIRATSPFQDSPVNPFEYGMWAFPLFAANFIVFGFAVTYHKNKLPSVIQKSIKFILNFDVSHKIAYIVVIILITIYISLTVNELAVEEDWYDYSGVRDAAVNWTFTDPVSSMLNFRYFLLHESLNIFGNIRVIPFIASIALLLLTYLITLEMSKKRFAAILSLAILLQSNLFFSYDTSATYENLWTLFYLLSLYLIYKKWYLSPIAYIFSAMSKLLTIMFIPMTLLFIYRSNIVKRKKVLTAISYGVIIGLLAMSYSLSYSPLQYYSGFDYYDFVDGFTSFSFQLRFDGLVLIFLLPLVVGLFIASRKGMLHADSIMVLISGVLISAPLLSGFTLMSIQPYRFVPLVVFFAMGVGIIFSKKLLNRPNYFP